MSPQRRGWKPLFGNVCMCPGDPEKCSLLGSCSEGETQATAKAIDSSVTILGCCVLSLASSPLFYPVTGSENTSALSTRPLPHPLPTLLSICLRLEVIIMLFGSLDGAQGRFLVLCLGLTLVVLWGWGGEWAIVVPRRNRDWFCARPML